MRPGTLLRWQALRNILKSQISPQMTACGIGSYDGYIESKAKKLGEGIDFTIIDLDHSGLVLAKEKGLQAVCASGLELPFKDGTVDLLLCLDVIEHIDDDRKLVGEISRVLKKSGRVILTTPRQEGISFPFLSEEKIQSTNIGWGHLRRGYSLEKIEELFCNSKLSIIKSSKYFNVLSRFLYGFSYIQSCHFPGMGLLFKAAIRLEPFIKWRGQDHIIVGERVE